MNSASGTHPPHQQVKGGPQEGPLARARGRSVLFKFKYLQHMLQRVGTDGRAAGCMCAWPLCRVRSVCLLSYVSGCCESVLR